MRSDRNCGLQAVLLSLNCVTYLEEFTERAHHPGVNRETSGIKPHRICARFTQSMQLMKTFLTVGVLFVGVSLSFLSPSLAQQATPVTAADAGPLRDTIARMDRKLFDVFNAHNADTLMTLFTEDLEFFQDNDGFKDYQRCARDFKALFANNTDIKRELVPETLEVYPIKDYGAIEIGTHRFCHKDNGQIECALFRFVMIWRKSGENWKVSRVVSFGHKL